MIGLRLPSEFLFFLFSKLLSCAVVHNYIYNSLPRKIRFLMPLHYLICIESHIYCISIKFTEVVLRGPGYLSGHTQSSSLHAGWSYHISVELHTCMSITLGHT